VGRALLKASLMKFPLPLLLFVLAGCASWHWEKPGASADDYERDEKYCKLQVYSGIDGAVTQASVRRMHACLEGRGWRKAED